MPIIYIPSKSPGEERVLFQTNNFRAVLKDEFLYEESRIEIRGRKGYSFRQQFWFEAIYTKKDPSKVSFFASLTFGGFFNRVRRGYAMFWYENDHTLKPSYLHDPPVVQSTLIGCLKYTIQELQESYDKI